MAATLQTQGFLGGVKIGGQLYTVRGNPQFRANRNIDVTGMIGTGFPYLFAEGIQTPTITMSIVGRDKVAGNPFSATFLGYFLSRYPIGADNATLGTTAVGAISAPVWETPVIGTYRDDNTISGYGNCTAAMAGASIAFSDGESVICIYNAKAESLRIGTAKGQDINVEATFVGTRYRLFRWGTTAGPATVTTAELQTFLPTTGDCSSVLRFNSWTFTNTSASLADKVFGINVSYSNNHTPNMGLDGKLTPIYQNAGMPNAGISLTLQALDGIPGEYGQGGIPPGMEFTITGTTGTAVFTAPAIIAYNPYDRSAPMGRVLRNYSYTCLGKCGEPNTMSEGILVASTTNWT